MDRNSIIGVILIVLILAGFSWWLSPSAEEKAAQARQQDSIVRVERAMADAMKAEKTAREQSATLNTADTTIIADTTKTAKQNTTASASRDLYGSFANSSKGTDKFYTLESEKLRILISRKGGGVRKIEIKGYKTFDMLPLVLYNSDTALLGFTFFSNNRDISTKNLYFEPSWIDGKDAGQDVMTVSGSDSISFAMRLYPDAGDSSVDKSKYIEFRYTLKGNDFMTGYAINAVGMKDVLATNLDYVNLDWQMDMHQLEKSHENEKIASSIYFKYIKDEVDYISERKLETKSLKTKVKWISFKQQFFSATLIADDAFGTAEIETYSTGDTNRYLKSMAAEISVPVNLSAKESHVGMRMYFGPNKYSTFRKYHLDLERQIPLGWSFFLLAWINKFAVIPVFDFLSGFSLNYGIIILILTILLKIVLFPIAYKTYLSSAKMRVLKPEVEEITAKYPKKEDALKKQQATMDLYKRAGINPMAGCVPMLLQLPILIAMFRFFPASIELRQQPFLWATDLSSYDSIWNLPFNIPYYGDHVSLFTLLMTVSTIMYTKMTNDQMSGTQQMPGMKTMMYIMPIMFLGFFNSYSSGLSYYYLLANLLTFAQMWIIRRVVDEDKIHKQIQENKKKPVKKSNFQKRLETMANQRGLQTKR